jgi:pSer/pThr/pTyr-binding forkhead associated (FHA) protein
MAMIIQTIDGVVVNRYEIGDKPVTFGRTPENDIQIDDRAVSNRHAEVVREDDDTGSASYYLVDLGSTNGSFVNEIMVGKKPLKHRDKIRIGWNDFTFFDESAAGFEETSEVKKSWIPGIYYSK